MKARTLGIVFIQCYIAFATKKRIPNSVRRQSNSFNLTGSDSSNTNLGSDWFDYLNLSPSSSEKAGTVSTDSIENVPAKVTNVTIITANNTFNVVVSKCATQWDLELGPWQFFNGSTTDAVTWRQIWSDAHANGHQSGSFVNALQKGLSVNAALLSSEAQSLATQYIQDVSANGPPDIEDQILHNELRHLLQNNVEFGGIQIPQEWLLIIITGLATQIGGMVFSLHYYRDWFLEDYAITKPANETIVDSLWVGLIGFATIYSSALIGFLVGQHQIGQLGNLAEAAALVAGGILARYRQLILGGAFLNGIGAAAARSGVGGKFTQDQFGEGILSLSQVDNPALNLTTNAKAEAVLAQPDSQCS